MNLMQKKDAFLALTISLIFLLLCYNVINAEEKIKIYADEVRVDEVNEKVTATGNAVAVNEDNIKIKSNLVLLILKKSSEVSLCKPFISLVGQGSTPVLFFNKILS